MSTTPSNEDFIQAVTAELPAVRAFVTALMPGHSNVEELMKRTSLTFWRERGGYEPGSDLRAWAFCWAKWTLRTYAKQKHYSSWVLEDENLTRLIANRLRDRMPASADATQAALDQCLENLRPMEREMLLGRYVLQQAAPRRGRRRDAEAGTLKVTLLRLRAALRSALSERLLTGPAKA